MRQLSLFQHAEMDFTCMARHGENIHKRKDGRWEARVIVGYDDNHKAIYKSYYGNTYEEVKQKKELSGDLKPSRLSFSITFDEAALEWLSSRKGKIKISSYNHYLNQYELHIKPVFADQFLRNITSEQYSHFLIEKEKEGYSSGTLCLIRTIIMMILKHAEETHDILTVHDIYMPKQNKNDVEAFTKEEQLSLNHYLYEHIDHYANAVALSMYCGLRIGEVCALQWKDLNLDQGVLTVSKTLIRVQNKENEEKSRTQVVIQKPKTSSSNRKVPIPDCVVKELLRSFHDDPECYVITGTDHYMEPRVCLRKFKKIVSELNMEHYTFHACRHTYATRCVELGIDAKILSEMLGHSSVRTTLDRYVHPSMDFKKSQVNKFSELNDNL